MVDDQQVPKSWFLQYRALTRPVVGHSLRQRPAKVLIAYAFRGAKLAATDLLAKDAWWI
jgi:hypothetical protein